MKAKKFKLRIADHPYYMLKGLYTIIVDPDLLITDYIGVGGLGASFVNSGLLTLVSIYILYRLKVKVTGATISTIWLMSGFALFGLPGHRPGPNGNSGHAGHKSFKNYR